MEVFSFARSLSQIFSLSTFLSAYQPQQAKKVLNDARKSAVHRQFCMARTTVNHTVENSSAPTINTGKKTDTERRSLDGHQYYKIDSHFIKPVAMNGNV
ncbi:hypothetical protein ElyMa_004952400 [Elysia marginata]|uniref:Uncharacterized protein n=1 Tax=Elysia marginata TaxID=1093978 RepID=A0AAV4J5L3_9GAST|nr:hypothetical protein ElyMa_004952400 [Elysia marginata]